MRTLGSRRGQTILELTFVTMWVAVFFVFMGYIATVFDVGQKQTMLLRNQALIELGNYSYFGSTEHGKDKVGGKESQVTFKLGERSRFVKVDFEKVEKFKKAVEGDLELNISQSTKDDPYWNTYRFPKGKTTLFWDAPRAAGGSSAGFNIELSAEMKIASNRSIDFEKQMNPTEYVKTGMFSGSVHFSKYAQIANLEPRVAEGLEDNVDMIRRALKQIVKADPSLSNEAKNLEENVNVADAVSGGAVASLISLAISAIAQVGFAAVSDATGGFGSEAGGAAGSGGSALDNYFKSITSQFTDPYSAASNFMGDSLLSAPLQAVASPFINAYEGVTGTFGELGSMAAGGGDFLALAHSLAQIGQTAQLAAGFAGQNIQGLNIATAALELPGAINSGLNKIDVGMNYDPSLAVGGGVNFSTVMSGVSEITSAASNFLVTVAPDMAVPMSYVNAAVSVASIGASLPGKVDVLSNAATAGQTLKAAGDLTANLGGLYSNVAYLSGQKGDVGSILQMVGGGMMIAGTGAEFLANAKLKGFDVALKEKVDANIDNAKDTLNSFQTRIADATAKFNAGMADLAGANRKVGDEGTDFFKNVKDKLIDPSTGFFSDDRVAGGVTNSNLLKMDNVVNELETKMTTQFHLAGADQATVAGLAPEFSKVRDAVGTLQALKAGTLVQDDSNRDQIQSVLRAGNEAVNNLNQQLNKQFQDQLNQRILRGMMDQQNSNQWKIAQDLLVGNQKYEDAKAVEKEANGGNPLKTFVSYIDGGKRTKETYEKQLHAAYNLAYVTKVKERAETNAEQAKDEQARALQATQIAESISTTTPIKTDDIGHLRQGAADASSLIGRVLERNPAGTQGGLDEKTRLRMEAAQRKLNDIISGAHEVQSPPAALQALRMEVGTRNATFKRLKSIYEQCAAGQCPQDTN